MVQIETNATLLDRLKTMDAHDSWREFYDIYCGVIMGYARKLGLNDAQAQDVVQETMVALMRKLPQFTYDKKKGRFLNYLLSITHGNALAIHRRSKRLLEVPFEEELAANLPDINEKETLPVEAEANWKECLIEEATQRVKLRVEPESIAVYIALVHEQRSVEEVAKEFDIKPNAVYQIKARITRYIKTEVAYLMKNCSEE